jgi:hypothetical protein
MMPNGIRKAQSAYCPQYHHARFHYKSNIENINFDQTRNLDRNTILHRLANEFVEKIENILITGEVLV